MKKWNLIMVVFLLIVFVGCQSKNTDLNHDSYLTEYSGVSDTTSSTERVEHVEPPAYIGVRSLVQLDEMRLMLQKPDQELNSYLLSVEGGGADSREDLEKFLKLITSLPNLELVDGNVSWIAYYTDPDVVYISTKSSNGDWTRVEYFLETKDISSELEELRAKGELDKSIISDVVPCKNGRVKIYSEVREQHPSGSGDTVEWMVTIDNIFARVVYFTADSSEVRAYSIFEDAPLMYISTVQEEKQR